MVERISNRSNQLDEMPIVETISDPSDGQDEKEGIIYNYDSPREESPIDLRGSKVISLEEFKLGE